MITKKTNDYIITFIKKHMWSAWTGVILGMMGVDPISIQFFVYFVPLVILVNISKRAYMSEVADKIQEGQDKKEEKKQKDKNLDFFR